MSRVNAAARVADAVRGRVSVQRRARIARQRVALRRPTAGLRALPDFLVIGTMRGGSSSLFRWLCAHPDVARPLRKEIEYFNVHHDRGEGWYRQHFPLRARGALGRARHHPLQTFEATPCYLFHPEVPRRAAALLPDARLVALLRDPVERAYSHYRHMRQLGFEKLSFPEAVAAEESRLAPELEHMRQDPGYFSRIHARFSYVSRGRYAEQLERWLAHYPRSQLLVVESRDLYTSPAECLTGITRFLGLSDWLPEEFRNYSRPHTEVTRPMGDPGLQRELYAAFEEPDRRLAEVWGHVPSWRDGG
ncbi:sulfotransferase domain-containing protein [Nocardioides sp. GXQ0305]|uniref:sulfotransferase domain-containing protein n=1 Tax=Nocardioides sp. GXQ0305 TaxID=3423912 RepID=UPI003D7CC9F0